MGQIKDYKILPIGRAKDYSNQTIGDFLVLYRTEIPKNSNSKEAHWLCQCQNCKSYIVKPLSRFKGICECKYDLTGQKLGRWTVQYLTNSKTKNGSKIWHCKCECGNEKDVDAYTLKSGQSKSCGCLNLELFKERSKLNKIDLTGKRFGKLVAMYPIYSKEGKHTKWHCICDCGNECDIDMGNLRSGKSQSCGCTQSKQEENIIKLLMQANIPFTYHEKFLDLKNKEFDFRIGTELEKGYIVEYDGQQHFKYTGTGWDTKEHFKRTRESDLIKNHYCFRNNIPLIRIPYDADYTIDDLKLETTRFLLTPENEEKYYSLRA